MNRAEKITQDLQAKLNSAALRIASQKRALYRTREQRDIAFAMIESRDAQIKALIKELDAKTNDWLASWLEDA